MARVALIGDNSIEYISSLLDIWNNGDCADIRSGKLEDILNGTVGMDDYITVTLPEGVTQSDYKYWLGSHGGAAFLKEGQTQELTLENTVY